MSVTTMTARAALDRIAGTRVSEPHPPWPAEWQAAVDALREKVEREEDEKSKQRKQMTLQELEKSLLLVIPELHPYHFGYKDAEYILREASDRLRAVRTELVDWLSAIVEGRSGDHSEVVQILVSFVKRRLAAIGVRS